MKEYIKEKVNSLVKKHGTRDLLELLDAMNIIIVSKPMDDSIHGFYCNIIRNQIICVNDKLSDEHKKCVIAHELGHAILHKNLNVAFLSCNTFYCIDKFELEANIFATELLITDEMLIDFKTIDESSKTLGIPKNLVELKYKLTFSNIKYS